MDIYSHMCHWTFHSEINFAYNVCAAIFGAISLSTHSRPGQAQPWCRPLLQVASSPRDWSSAQSSWAQGCCRVSSGSLHRRGNTLPPAAGLPTGPPSDFFHWAGEPGLHRWVLGPRRESVYTTSWAVRASPQFPAASGAYWVGPLSSKLLPRARLLGIGYNVISIMN